MIEIYHNDKKIEQWTIEYPNNAENITKSCFVNATRRIYTCILLTPGYVRYRKGEPLSYKIIYGRNEIFFAKQYKFIKFELDKISIDLSYLETLPTESKPMKVTSHQPSISGDYSGDRTHGKSPSEILSSRSLTISTTPGNVNAFARPKSNSLKLSKQNNDSFKSSKNYEEMRTPEYSRSGEVKRVKADEEMKDHRTDFTNELKELNRLIDNSLILKEKCVIDIYRGGN